MGKLDGRVVLITGAARGQGAAEARLFAAEGARVVLADVLDGEGKAVAAELGEDRARYVPLDVGSEEDWAAALTFTTDAFGKLDGLINNAGILRFNELSRTPLEEYLQVVQVNQVGTFLGMRTVIPAFEAAGGGTIVNIASYAALAGMPLVTSYAATKGAVLGMTRVAALELAPKRIRVNAVCPGAVDTPMTNPDHIQGGPKAPAAAASSADLDAFYAKLIPLARMGRPEEIAKLTLYLTCDDSSYVTGQPFVIDGGMMAGPAGF